MIIHNWRKDFSRRTNLRGLWQILEMCFGLFNWFIKVSPHLKRISVLRKAVRIACLTHALKMFMNFQALPDFKSECLKSASLQFYWLYHLYNVCSNVSVVFTVIGMKSGLCRKFLIWRKELDSWKWAAATIKAISHLRLCCCTEYYRRCDGAEGTKPAALCIHCSVSTWETNLVASVSVTLIRLSQQLRQWMAGCLPPSTTFGYSVTDILSGSRKAVFVAAIL